MFSKGLQFMGFMKAVPIILLLLFVLVITNTGIDLGGILPGAGTGKQLRGEVVRVIDGDTLVVKTATKQETVRMIGIDTPETVRPGVSVECGGPQASDFMKKLATGQSVRLVTDPTQSERDTYDRLLAYVYPSTGNISYQERTLAAGWAELYIYGNKPFQEVKPFREASETAQDKGAGVYAMCNGDFHSAS